MSTPAPSATDTLVDTVLGDASGVVVRGAAGGRGPGRALVAPVDGASWTQVRTGTREDALDAADAAARVAPSWAATTGSERARVLRAVAADLDAAASTDAWPRLVTRETGKPLSQARGELSLSAVYFRVFADLVESQGDTRFDVVAGTTHVVTARPVGAVLVLTPWNFPVSIPARKVAAALAAGCTVLMKPSEVAPLSGVVLQRLLERHLPEGVVATVLGEPEDVVDPWLAHDGTGAVSFTGSTRVGALVAAAAAPRFVRTVLELGGCAPFVVLPDADPEQAAATLAVAKYRNNGQSCIAANQVFVAREVAEPFLEAFARTTSALVVGDPLDDATDVGPLAVPGDPARLAGLVDAAVAAGARVAATARVPRGPGHWAAPTLLVDVPAEADAFATEVFGPLASVRTFDDLDDVVATHRATGYGLAAYVCGSDTGRSREVAERLRAGVVGIGTGTPNYPGAPFGGSGLSGLGYEGGQQGLDAFVAYRTTAVTGA